MVGKVISSKYETMKHNKNFYTLVVKCPACHKTSEYKNMHQNKGKLSPLYPVICRHCHAKFDISSQDSFL